jgi:D-mannonate dehydratase
MGKIQQLQHADGSSQRDLRVFEAKKVKKLQIEIRRKECKVSAIERMKQHDPIKLHLEDAKKALAKEQREHQHS